MSPYQLFLLKLFSFSIPSIIKYFFVPILSFLLFFFGNHFYLKWKEFKKLVSLKKFIIVWLDDCKYQLTNTEEAIKIFIDSIKSINRISYILHSYPSYPYFILNLDEKEIADALVFKSTGKEKENAIMLTKLMISMKFQEDLNEVIKSRYETFIEDRNKVVVSHNMNFKNLLTTKDEMGSKVDYNQTSAMVDFHKKADELFRDYKQNSNSAKRGELFNKLDIQIKHLIKPLSELTSEYFLKVDDARLIANQCASIAITYHEIALIHSDTTKNLEVFQKNVAGILSDIDKLLNHMNKTKVKYW